MFFLKIYYICVYTSIMYICLYILVNFGFLFYRILSSKSASLPLEFAINCVTDCQFSKHDI